jgi:hypothetical protein
VKTITGFARVIDFRSRPSRVENFYGAEVRRRKYMHILMDRASSNKYCGAVL